jgi:undecaprenyl-diphosphatase
VLELIKIVMLGIVQGITEFLPISSTGHLIVGVALLDPALTPTERSTFEIFIQLGTVVAVVLFYLRDLLHMGRDALTRDADGVRARRFILAVLVAVLPAAVIGFSLREAITATLFNPFVVAWSLIIGGIALIVVEQLPAFRRRALHGTGDIADVTARQALLVGCFQVMALVPGVSRSAASIIGGMVSGMERQTATRFSFYLAIPTLGGATVAQLLLSLDEISPNALLAMFVGAVVAGIVAYFAIAWLLRYVARNSFVPFGIYRILAGVVILLLFAANVLP